MLAAPGFAEILVVAFVALVVFGPRRLPEIARTVGKGIRVLRKAARDVENELRASLDEPVDSSPKRPYPAEPEQPDEPGDSSPHAG